MGLRCAAEATALSLDDFGTDHSSLSRLIHLPFSTIEVNRGVVWDNPGGPGATVVVSLVGLASALRMIPVVESLDYDTHDHSLCSQGYAPAKVFRYARPQHELHFLPWLADWRCA